VEKTKSHRNQHYNKLHRRFATISRMLYIIYKWLLDFLPKWATLHKTCLSASRLTQNLIAISAQNHRLSMAEYSGNVKASRTLHIHEKAVRSWYKPLELVFTLLGSWIRVKQIVLNLLPNESVDCWNTTSTAGICESKTRYIRKWPKEAKKNRHDSHNMPMINISFSCCLKKISTTNITKFQEAPSLTTSDPKYGICPLPTRHKEHERISY